MIEISEHGKELEEKKNKSYLSKIRSEVGKKGLKIRWDKYRLEKRKAAKLKRERIFLEKKMDGNSINKNKYKEDGIRCYRYQSIAN